MYHDNSNVFFASQRLNSTYRDWFLLMDKILLGHGSGGKMMHQLIREHFSRLSALKAQAIPLS